jgi:hypothetical protein
MAQTQYAWGNRVVEGLDAQKVGEYLEDLYQRFDGYLTKDEILAKARSQQSPLHKYFEWDENEAAERYRRRQVSYLLSTLRVKKNGKVTRTRAFVFVHDPKHDGRKVYVNIRSAMGNPEMKRQLVERAHKELTRWIGAYGGARELRFVAPLVDRLQRKIEAELLAAAS